MMAILSASTAVITASSLLALDLPVMTGYVFVGLFTGFATAMTAFWLTRWPTRRQSALTMSAGILLISAWSVVQPSSALAVLGCTATTVTGGYLTLSSPDIFHLSGNAIDKLGDVGGPGATIFASVLTDGSENLRSARRALDRLVGRDSTEEMLDALFGRFCIGK